MKRIVLFIFLIVAFSSCDEEVKFNDPGFQALKENVLFKGTDVKAYKSASTGALRIVANGELEKIELRTSNSTIGTYYLGSTDLNTATYSNNFDDKIPLFYSSRNSFGPVLSICNAILSSGANYLAGNSVSTTSTGSGSGMKVNTTITELGAINSIKISAAGTGYKVNDIITVTGGNNNAKFRILSEIIITNNSNNTVTGTFKFNAKKSTSDELINFQHGAFRNIPIINEL